MKVSKAVVLTFLLYIYESKQLATIVSFLSQQYKEANKNILQGRIRNTEVLRHVNMPTIDAIIMKTQERLSGHLIKASDNQIPKKMLYGELCCNDVHIVGNCKATSTV